MTPSTLTSSLSELPEYRQVLANLIARDLKVKYQSKSLGFAWSLLAPAIMIGILYAVFSRGLRVQMPDYWAFLLAGMEDACNGDVFNVGGCEPIAHRDLVTILIDAAGRGTVRHVPWPADKQRIDIGSFYSDSSKFTAATGWRPATGLGDGLRRTLAYYREHFDRYVEPDEPTAR